MLSNQEKLNFIEEVIKREIFYLSRVPTGSIDYRETSSLKVSLMFVQHLKTEALAFNKNVGEIE